MRHDEAVKLALQWMRDNYGPCKNLSPSQQDKYHENLGLICHFLHTLIPHDKAYENNPPGTMER
jgi:hypothetical protein